MRLDYRILNVFARPGERLSGNPLCVFEDGSGLDSAQMQALALQFNLSETTFILPSRTADARVRIFTPAYEMPFAGHPTLGTAHVVRSLRRCADRVRLELAAGVIPVAAERDFWELRANTATTRAPRAAVICARSRPNPPPAPLTRITLPVRWSGRSFVVSLTVDRFARRRTGSPIGIGARGTISRRRDAARSRARSPGRGRRGWRR